MYFPYIFIDDKEPLCRKALRMQKEQFYAKKLISLSWETSKLKL